ncbi:p2xA [Symbiodinium natans]|uniref:p2xA protein n=1 Tax=Symbiodinium natans TaxID=878477 RepID=A0A812N5B8_9DINO|nr:p2xA [Symbiodinium natans]
MSDGMGRDKAIEPMFALEAQVARLKEQLVAEKQHSAEKDQKLEMMEAVVTRLQSRIELLEDHLKEQQRKNRIMKGNGEAVLELQQQLAEELAKRKQAQYELIAKAKELCDVQQCGAAGPQVLKGGCKCYQDIGHTRKMAGSRNCSAQDRTSHYEARKELPRGTQQSWSPEIVRATTSHSPATPPPALVLPLSGLSAKSPSSSFFAQGPTCCTCPAGSATPQTPPAPTPTVQSARSARTSPSLSGLAAGEGLGDRVKQRKSPVVPMINAFNAESVLIRPPADDEGPGAVSAPKVSWYGHLHGQQGHNAFQTTSTWEPGTPAHLQDAPGVYPSCQSGHATPVSPVFQHVHLDYPRILTSRHEVRTGVGSGFATAAKSARVISPPLSARLPTGPLVLPAAQVVVCEGIHF